MPRRSPVPDRVWVAFDKRHFPIGVTKLVSEARLWEEEAATGLRDNHGLVENVDIVYVKSYRIEPKQGK